MAELNTLPAELAGSGFNPYLFAGGQLAKLLGAAFGGGERRKTLKAQRRLTEEQIRLARQQRRQRATKEGQRVGLLETLRSQQASPGRFLAQTRSSLSPHLTQFGGGLSQLSSTESGQNIGALQGREFNLLLDALNRRQSENIGLQRSLVG
jgi:hypothetical protein